MRLAEIALALCIFPLQTTQHGRNDGIPSYRLNGNITKVALEMLVEYAYTAQLIVPDALVKDVYLAAWQLRIETIINKCTRHLIDELTADSCIEIRSLPGINKNKAFAGIIDDYISKEVQHKICQNGNVSSKFASSCANNLLNCLQFEGVSKTPAFLQFNCVTIDVLYQTKSEMAIVTHQSLCRLVLDWLKRQMGEENVTFGDLLERPHMLYLALDNTLQDCCDLPLGHESESDLVQDYKRMVLKNSNCNNRRRKQLSAPVRPRVLIYSRDIGERDNEKNAIEPDWNLLGSG